MKKSIVVLVAFFALIATPVAAHEGHDHGPKAGAACALSGSTKTVKGLTYVCMPTKIWSQGLMKSKSPLTVKDQWVKAANTGMTAAFGFISNPTKKDIYVIAARSPQYATTLQLHEVVKKVGTNDMVMQEKAKGFLVPAGKTVELKPGGDHLMFMGLKKPITAGAIVPITLIGSQGEQLRFTALGKVFTGANENYEHSGM